MEELSLNEIDSESFVTALFPTLSLNEIDSERFFILLVVSSGFEPEYCIIQIAPLSSQLLPRFPTVLSCHAPTTRSD